MAEGKVHFTAAGDIIIQRRLFEAGNEPPHGYMQTLDFLRTGDVVWASFEVQLSKRGFRTDSTIAYLADPVVASDLAKAGYSLMTVATNHTWDFGPDAFVDTLTNLRQAGITPVGGGSTAEEANAPVFLDVNGLRIAVVAVSCLVPPYYAATDDRPGIAALRINQSIELNGLDFMLEPGAPVPVRSSVEEEDMQRLTSLIKKLSSEVDFVLVSVHWGYGRGDTLAEYQRPLGRRIIEAGADMVLGNHMHSPGGVDIHHGKPIIYSLGNHLAQHSYKTANEKQKKIFASIDPWSVVARFTLARHKVEKLEFFATECDEDGMPCLVESPEVAAPVLRRLQRMSSDVGNKIQIDGASAQLDLTAIDQA